MAALRAALHDGDLEAVLLVGAVGDRLVEAAMLGFGEPVGAEAHLVEGQRRAGKRQCRSAGGKADRDISATCSCGSFSAIFCFVAGLSSSAALISIHLPRRQAGAGAQGLKLAKHMPRIASPEYRREGPGTGRMAHSRTRRLHKKAAARIPIRCARYGPCQPHAMIVACRIVRHGSARLTPTKIRAPFARYSHGIEVPARARLVFCSGQLGVGADDEIPVTVEGQAELCFTNIARDPRRGGPRFRRHRPRQRLCDGARTYEGLHGRPRPLCRQSAAGFHPDDRLGLHPPEFLVEVEVDRGAAD